jgi:hypothetical protein
MRKFFAEQKEGLTEMAVSKMPEGTKRKRSATYASHDIHVDGEHVATIVGHKANRFQGGRGLPAHAKLYSVHKDEAGMLKNEPHPDHAKEETHTSYERDANGHMDYDKPVSHKYQAPVHYHSMDDAVEAVTHAHRNNKEFGAGHDPKTRWAHAVSLSAGHEDHEKKAEQYKTAIHHAKALGHDDVVSALQNHADAHAAKGSKPAEHKLKQWTHDAHAYTATKYVSPKYEGNVKVKDGEHVPVHPEHHGLAVQAHNVHVYGNPTGFKRHSY